MTQMPQKHLSGRPEFGTKQGGSWSLPFCHYTLISQFYSHCKLNWERNHSFFNFRKIEWPKGTRTIHGPLRSVYSSSIPISISLMTKKWDWRVRGSFIHLIFYKLKTWKITFPFLLLMTVELEITVIPHLMEAKPALSLFTKFRSAEEALLWYLGHGA